MAAQFVRGRGWPLPFFLMMAAPRRDANYEIPRAARDLRERLAAEE